MLVQVMWAGAELIDDRVQRKEELLADVVLAQMIPQVFDRVELGAVGQELEQVEGERNPQGDGFVPTGAIPQHQVVVVRKAGGDVRKEEGPGLGIYPVVRPSDCLCLWV